DSPSNQKLQARLRRSRWVPATGHPKIKASITNRGLLFSADETQRLCRERRRRKALPTLCCIHSGRSPLNSNGRVPAHFVRRDFQNFAKTARACHNISNCGSYSVDVHPSRSCADRVIYSAAFVFEGRFESPNALGRTRFAIFQNLHADDGTDSS